MGGGLCSNLRQHIVEILLLYLNNKGFVQTCYWIISVLKNL